MLKRRKAQLAVGLALLCVLGTSPMAAQALTNGSANAGVLGYNANLGLMQYNCSFAGWSSTVNKDWSCELESYDGYQYAYHSGEFSGTGHSTSTYSYAKTGTVMCVVAKANYVSGSAGTATDRRCD
jgi:hypothetical protein